MTETANEVRRQYLREWRKRNKDKVKGYVRKYRGENPEKVKQWNHEYWERKAAAGGVSGEGA